MTALAIILLILFLLAILPLGVRVRYDEAGVWAWAKVWLFRIRLAPKKPKSPRQEEKARKKRAKKAKKKAQKEQKKKAKKEAKAEGEKKKGGSLAVIKAALPLLKSTLSGVKKRLTVRDLELHVTWAAKDPADAAVGYGYAQAALGTLWAVIDQNFKVKKSSLGCGVDFDQTSPTVYADATVKVRLGQVITLVLPLTVKFLRALSKEKKKQKAKAEKIKAEEAGK